MSNKSRGNLRRYGSLNIPKIKGTKENKGISQGNNRFWTPNKTATLAYRPNISFGSLESEHYESAMVITFKFNGILQLVSHFVVTGLKWHPYLCWWYPNHRTRCYLRRSWTVCLGLVPSGPKCVSARRDWLNKKHVSLTWALSPEKHHTEPTKVCVCAWRTQFHRPCVTPTGLKSDPSRLRQSKHVQKQSKDW